MDFSSGVKRIVIVGATSRIAEYCSRIWVSSSPVDMTLVGRNHEKLSKVAQDLNVRNSDANVDTYICPSLDVEDVEKVVAELASRGPIDQVLIAYGSLSDQALCEGNLKECAESLWINGVSVVLFAEAFAQHMNKTGQGGIAVIGSVAGDRGRKSNYVYGAAKGLVERYVQGLQHRLATSSIKVVLLKPGPTDTPMTAHLKADGLSLAPVEQVAAEIVKAIEKDRPVAYVPGRWWVIMMVIRHLPRFVFNRLNI